MTQILRIPKVAVSMREGTLVAWLAEDGAVVAERQPLFTLELEKSTMDVESPAAGVLRHKGQAGVTYKVGEIIGEISAPVPQALLVLPGLASPTTLPALDGPYADESAPTALVTGLVGVRVGGAGGVVEGGVNRLGHVVVGGAAGEQQPQEGRDVHGVTPVGPDPGNGRGS